MIFFKADSSFIANNSRLSVSKHFDKMQLVFSSPLLYINYNPLHSDPHTLTLSVSKIPKQTMLAPSFHYYKIILSQMQR